VHDPETAQVLHYVEKPESWISSLINGGIYRECWRFESKDYRGQ
jgi:hypothetical protein